MNLEERGSTEHLSVPLKCGSSLSVACLFVSCVEDVEHQ